jgi:sirohydrochlorin ferrochelatase
VLMVAHGSPDPAANEPVAAVAAMVAAEGGFGAVSVGYLGLNAPLLPAAIDALLAAGHAHVVVAPYLLQLGGHAAEDVPQAVAEARARHPAARIVLAAHLGYDPLLAEVLAARASAALYLDKYDLLY